MNPNTLKNKQLNYLFLIILILFFTVAIWLTVDARLLKLGKGTSLLLGDGLLGWISVSE